MLKMNVGKMRRKIINLSGGLEVYISILIIIAIAVFSVNIVFDILKIFQAFFTEEDPFFMQTFLSRSLELVIALELVKMIANNTPGSTIEVLIFAIARSIITSHGTPMSDLLFGIVAIAVLFGIRKWAHKMDRNLLVADRKNIKKPDKNSPVSAVAGKILSGETLVSKLSEMVGFHISARLTDTLSSLMESCIKNQKSTISEGDMLEIDGLHLVVHRLDHGRIDQVEVVSAGISEEHEGTTHEGLGADMHITL